MLLCFIIIPLITETSYFIALSKGIIKETLPLEFAWVFRGERTFLSLGFLMFAIVIPLYVEYCYYNHYISGSVAVFAVVVSSIRSIISLKYKIVSMEGALKLSKIWREFYSIGILDKHRLVEQKEGTKLINIQLKVSTQPECSLDRSDNGIKKNVTFYISKIKVYEEGKFKTFEFTNYQSPALIEL